MIEQTHHHYKLLDFIRVYCALLVVLIHMGFGDRAAFIPCVTQQAVPFFFLASGFFFTKRIRRESHPVQYTLQYAKSILIVYVFWVCLWTPYLIHEIVAQHASRSLLYKACILVRRICLVGMAPFWYLLALAEGVLLLVWILRRNAYRLGWLMCLVGIALKIVFDLHPSSGIGFTIYKLFYTVFSWDCNVIMTGFPLLFLGSIFAKNESSLQRLRRPFVAFSYFFVIGVAFFSFRNLHFFAGIPWGIMEALLLFAFCVIPSAKVKYISPSVCLAARNLSSVIFLTHTSFLILIANVFHIWNTAPRLALTIVFSSLLTCCLKRINLKPVNSVFLIK